MTIDFNDAPRQREDRWTPPEAPQKPVTGSTIDRLKAVLPHPRTMPEGLKDKSGGEVAGPCPKCGGDDRFYIRANGSFGCRQCNPKGGDKHESDIPGLVARYLNGTAPKTKLSKTRAIEPNLKAVYDYCI